MKRKSTIKAVQQPIIPSILLTTTSGKVLMNHNGLIDDFDGMVKKIRE